MKESNHFALIFYETTDCTVTEQLAVHGRYIHKRTDITSSESDKHSEARN